MSTVAKGETDLLKLELSVGDGQERGEAGHPGNVSLPMLDDILIGRIVSYSPSKESWMRYKAYRPAGNSYIAGRVRCRVKEGRLASLFHVQ
ncbi:hypothetical protein GQ600_6671 [Phytophthora cactorum]|nr:hypothetical protein GQ600_6671 [Phytophthora cactorum]